MFTPPMSSSTEVTKEGSDYLIDCLLTDPSATDFSLCLANGSTIPYQLNYTVDPKRGILTQGLLPSHSGDYVCCAKLSDQRKVSQVYSLRVKSSKTMIRIYYINTMYCILQWISLYCHAVYSNVQSPPTVLQLVGLELINEPDIGSPCYFR